MNTYRSILIAALIGFLASTANATPVLCKVITNNHMYMDDTQASACVEAGVGNITGNPANDDFLNSGGTAAGYVDAGVGSTYGVTSVISGTVIGTWSVTSAVDAIGFKFGTGNTADEWFIFDLVAGVTSGDWTFIDVIAPGAGIDGRISHFQTYNKISNVPEPGMVGLLAIGLLSVFFGHRKMKV